jgi:phosphate transport system substrate-binding protein
VNWPTGAGGKGNEGVAAFVQRLPNSIGYVEYSYAKANKMSHVKLRNAAGQFVDPDDATFKAAAAGARWDQSFFQILTEQPGALSWPITGATFIVMQAKQDNPAKAGSALRFFDWALSNGDKMSSELEYVPMPDPVKAIIRREWAKIQDTSGKAIAFK